MYQSPGEKHGFQPSYQPVDAQNQNEHEQWKPSFFGGVPWLGTAGIFIAIASAVGSIAALYSANNKAVDSWPSQHAPIQLTVMLAVLIAIGNVGLRIAHKEGTTLTWWIKMSKGATLADSHRTWEHGSSAWSSALAILHLHISKIGLVSILMAFHFANGPLIQRATDVTTGSSIEPATFQAHFSPDMFEQATGYYQTRSSVASTLSTDFMNVILAHTNREPIKLDLKGCDGVCSGTLIGAGFDFDCVQTNQNYSVGPGYGNHGTMWDVGSIQVNITDKWYPDTVNVTTKYKGDAANVGNLTVTTCILHSARVRYPFTYTNGTVELEAPTPTTDGIANRTEEMIYLETETSGMGRFSSRLGGFGIALSHIYNSNVQLYLTGMMALQGEGLMQYSWISSNDSALGEVYMTWSDPTPSILGAFNEIAFRTAATFSNSSFEQTVQGTQKRTFIKYTINTNFLAASLAVTFASALAIVLLYHGFWLLGRPVTMSPLETAHAFQSPATAGADAVEADDLAKVFENNKVRGRLKFCFAVPTSPGTPEPSKPRRNLLVSRQVNMSPFQRLPNEILDAIFIHLSPHEVWKTQQSSASTEQALDSHMRTRPHAIDSLMLWACDTGDNQAVRKAVSLGADVSVVRALLNDSSYSERLTIYRASYYPDTVRLLLDLGARIDTDFKAASDKRWERFQRDLDPEVYQLFSDRGMTDQFVDFQACIDHCLYMQIDNRWSGTEDIIEALERISILLELGASSVALILDDGNPVGTTLSYLIKSIYDWGRYPSEWCLPTLKLLLSKRPDLNAPSLETTRRFLERSLPGELGVLISWQSWVCPIAVAVGCMVELGTTEVMDILLEAGAKLNLPTHTCFQPLALYAYLSETYDGPGYKYLESNGASFEPLWHYVEESVDDGASIPIFQLCQDLSYFSPDFYDAALLVDDKLFGVVKLFTERGAVKNVGIRFIEDILRPMGEGPYNADTQSTIIKRSHILLKLTLQDDNLNPNKPGEICGLFSEIVDQAINNPTGTQVVNIIDPIIAAMLLQKGARLETRSRTKEARDHVISQLQRDPYNISFDI
ncbi:uncharacterized protein FIESC28_04942 [Fusarium coffeatum]|uniref:F-box domain-containing protein n=1 Tax=Fusarium coffeatum TaxID=231269 RepID=A0A366RYG9_9HYPO|nr:uncharacterized protein FIESC28_04942 [Fusarium coffeatum]RBR21405.1 hypothetical protein FIESC28_04942 [Fusarium coffeatum]